MASGTLRAISTCTLCFAPVLHAQDAAQGVEEIIVTGSRIPRLDFASASPIVSLDGEAFERTASSSVETVLARMPQFVPEYGASSNNPGLGGRSTVQLRGLGSHSTLVLLDGKRLIPSDGRGTVDVNIVPPGLLERAEIVSGGASAVYGSDAVAGVVNFKLRPSFEGVQLDGTWGRTDRSDGEESTIGVTAGTGFADGRGQVFGYVGHSQRDGVTQAQREHSAYTWEYVGAGAGVHGPDRGFVPSGSPVVPEGFVARPFADSAVVEALFAGYGFPPGSVPYHPFFTQFGVNGDGTLFTFGNGEAGSVVNYRGQPDPVQFADGRFYTFNFAPFNYLQLPLERTSFFGRASYELSGGDALYAQLLYADYSSDTALAPTATNQLARLSMPRTNPYIPADLEALLDSREDPATDVNVGKRFLELGPREATNRYDVYQATVGARGDLRGGWTYEAYAQHGDNDQRESQDGLFLRSKALGLLHAPDGGLGICGEFDILRIGGVSPGCADYIRASGSNRSGYRQSVAEVSATGPAWTLPAGEIELALGLMYKRDEFFYHPDRAASVFLEDEGPDLVGFTAADDIEGDDHNTDVYVEASIPVLADADGFVYLETLLGYRRSEYASAGGVNAWKAEVLYQPIDVLRVRGSLQRAVRAPSVFELFQPRLPFGFAADEGFDPCDATSEARAGPDAARVEALCLAQGVPAELLAEFATLGGEVLGVSGGNEALEPETANTRTLGVVLSPALEHALLAQLQIAVDWFEIEVDETIEFIDSTIYLQACYDPVTNPALAASNFWCGFFSRDPDSGLPIDLVDTLVNLGRKTVSGVDMQIDWRVPAGRGNLAFNAVVSWLDRFELKPVHGLASKDLTGTVGNGIGGAQPERKGNLLVAYEGSTTIVGLQWRYIDAMRDADIFDLGDYGIGAVDYLDLFVEKTFQSGTLSGLTLYAGVENLTDEQPPLLPSAVAANTDPSQYDTLGRRFYLNASYRF